LRISPGTEKTPVQTGIKDLSLNISPGTEETPVQTGIKDLSLNISPGIENGPALTGNSPARAGHWKVFFAGSCQGSGIA
jgi:hypothetical protein